MSAVAAPAALSARRASKRYGRTVALSEVSLDIPAGSVTALVGPNGAGKSTLLRAWAGLEPLSGGAVAVCGADPRTDRSAAIASIGFVPQSAAVYGGLSVADHLEVAAHLRRGFDRDAAAARLADLGIPLGRRGGSLSGGQQAQLALALALGTPAAVLVLDEPLASLDPLARRDFLRVVRREAGPGRRTALLSSHVVGDIEQVCDRLAILGVGRLLYEGPIAEALAGHSVADGPAAAHDAVGSFAGFGADPQTVLLRGGGRGDRPPTLEELIFGYLAAGQGEGASR